MSARNEKTNKFNKRGLGKIVAIFVGFWSLFLVLYTLAPLIHDAIRSVIPMQVEYTVYEQLSKYYVFIVILISIYSYRILNEPIRIKISICFLVLGLALYLSESNMIAEMAQPIFAFIILAYTFFLLYRSRSWFVFFLLLLGCSVISAGVSADFASEHELVKSYIPQPISNVLSIEYEEIYDVTGIGFICISVIIYFIDTIEKFIKSNTIGTLCILTTSGLVTVGNGFLHFQYKRSIGLTSFALMMTISGFLGLLMTNKYVNKKDAMLTLITEEHFYLFVFSFFVVLPVIYGNITAVESLVIWLPTLIFLGLYLSYHHPVQRNEKWKLQ